MRLVRVSKFTGLPRRPLVLYSLGFWTGGMHGELGYIDSRYLSRIIQIPSRLVASDRFCLR